jgi:NADH-quinone oxidoreductase subunit J
MNPSIIIFYLIALMILVFGVLTVTTRMIFRSAIYLLFTLINVAALFFYLQYEFLAAVQIVVYVGGIVVLILFSLFLTHQVEAKLPAYSRGRIVASLFSVLFGLAFVFSLIMKNSFPQSKYASTSVAMSTIGTQLLNYGDGGYILPFEAVSVLLLAAMIGAIAIALKTKSNG